MNVNVLYFFHTFLSFFSLRGTPSFLLFDHSGTLRYKLFGEQPSILRRNIESLLNEKTNAPPVAAMSLNQEDSSD
jgi:hypothetical protein